VVSTQAGLRAAGAGCCSRWRARPRASASSAKGNNLWARIRPPRSGPHFDALRREIARPKALSLSGFGYQACGPASIKSAKIRGGRAPAMRPRLAARYRAAVDGFEFAASNKGSSDICAIYRCARPDRRSAPGGGDRAPRKQAAEACLSRRPLPASRPLAQSRR